jgi:hypothetical protein
MPPNHGQGNTEECGGRIGGIPAVTPLFKKGASRQKANVHDVIIIEEG